VSENGIERIRCASGNEVDDEREQSSEFVKKFK
jgi:hypothetical protein